MLELFKKYANLIVVLSEKSDGAMKFSPENRKRFFKKLGIDEELTIRADLVHKDNIKVVSNQDAGKTIEKTDGLITADKNLFLTITVADCLPIFIFDPEKEIIGLVHGGWRSLAKNILAKAVKDLSKHTLVGIGPGISQCHYEVKQDVLKEFKPYLGEALLNKNGKLFLDLKKIAKIQLINLGVKEKNIEISPECTFCLSDFKIIYLYNSESRFSSEARGSYKYFSYRRDKFKEVETMMAVIGRK